jgi:hypothetical protein
MALAVVAPVGRFREGIQHAWFDAQGRVVPRNRAPRPAGAIPLADVSREPSGDGAVAR